MRTRAEFTDFQLHVEFATPRDVKGDSQGRGNSGVFLLGKFEVQVLDSYQNPTYSQGQAVLYGYPRPANVYAAAGQRQRLRHRPPPRRGSRPAPPSTGRRR